MIVKKLKNCLFEKAVKHILVVANLTPARLQVANTYILNHFQNIFILFCFDKLLYVSVFCLL